MCIRDRHGTNTERFMFSDLLASGGSVISVDRQKAVTTDKPGKVGCDIDLASLTAQVSWKVRIIGKVDIGIVSTDSFFDHKNVQGKCWRLSHDGYFYDSYFKSLKAHGLHLSPPPSGAKVSYDPQNGAFTIIVNDQIYNAKVESKPNLIPIFWLDAGASVEFVQG
eukprot:TRINITY_DN16592_c0_g2_i1.p1 TRINITY_DN16592_c0_g2~~TRINITY_DN16592_c0_g2_i1.p1  ORF type:complete len:184 (+),score=13.27 TRINITY_DN16592_c0_g2_i1:60-554(+)